MTGDDERRGPGRAPIPLVLDRHVLKADALSRLAALAVALIAVYWLVDLVLLDAPPAVDRTVLDAVAERRTAAMIASARVLTLLGDLWFVAVVGVAVVVVAHRRAGRWDSAWLAGTVVGGALVVTSVVKWITLRARPDDALAATVSHAFPSGHASRAAAVCALIAWLGLRWGRRPATRAGFAVVATTLGIGVGVSRVVLGAHWATDVVGGWILGVAWFVGCIAITRPRRQTEASR